MKTLFILTAAVALAQDGGLPYPPQMQGAKVETYATVANAKLNLYIFDPPQKSTPRPAIVFFFGGGWTHGSPIQFEQHCRRLASLGFVAITADYRVETRHKSTVPDSIADARAALNYVQANAARLGIAPSRIAAGGGSAGGMLAAVAAMIPESPIAALVLFNPALVLAPIPGDEALSAWAASRITRPIFAGVDGASISPWHHVSKNSPPTLILHGKADTTVPYATVESFAAKMKQAGARCDLIGYDGEKHGFFNYKPGGTPAFNDTLKKAEAFLLSVMRP